jgi:uncharacterized membrane protein YbhN (UPF0104 family)
VLRRELQTVTLHDVAHELQSIPAIRLTSSLVLTAVGYLTLTGYDLLALQYLGWSLSWRRLISGSLVGFALANNLPFAFVVGGWVRYRLYSGAGVSAADTASIILFNIVTYSLGLATAAAVAFTLEPGAVPRLLGLPFSSTRPLGLVALGLVLGYLTWSWRGGRLRLAGRSFTPPPLSTSFKQIGVSLADWMLSAAALFVLLPAEHPISYLGLFGTFILGQIAALVAQLPGGLGVFEAVMLTTLSRTIPAASVAGALVAYRVIYFLLPLVLAAGFLGVREILRLLRGGTEQSSRTAGRP